MWKYAPTPICRNDVKHI